MDIEKDLLIAAPAARVWTLLLDPNVMGACVPGMQSIDVISDVEYVSVIHVKIAFISAKFRIKTTIVEQRAPHYLRTEGTGEDASVASSLKQSSEIFLTEREDGQTDLRMKIHVDVLGRLGTFGLSVMKTKADRMWDEFATNLAGRLAPEAALQLPTPADVGEANAFGAERMASSESPTLPIEPEGLLKAPPTHSTSPAVQPQPLPPAGLWARLLLALAPQATRATASVPPTWQHVQVDLHRGDTHITVYWPIEAAADCKTWLQEWTK